MKKPIIFIIFFTLFSFISFSEGATGFLTIRNLSRDNRNFVNFKQIITYNEQTWNIIKKNYKDSELQKLKTLSVAKYKTHSGDTIFSIAEKFNLVSDTIISFNSLANDLSISTGDTLLIPNMNGVVIFPSNTTSTERIARIYNIPESLLLYVNNIRSGNILAREEVFIPFARMSDEEKAYFISRPFIYPLDGGRFTSNYGKRFHPILHRWAFHGGVDIGTPYGSSVYASSDGKVIHVGPGNGYGNLIVIQHKYGYTSWYGHLSKYLVKVGDTVKQRELIAYSGNSGISTGPHLHFEIRRFNLRKNPMQVLSFNHQSSVFDTNSLN
jgi:murein DD-endopeptidase MepM/ murein hydrolase activator NlpD